MLCTCEVCLGDAARLKEGARFKLPAHLRHSFALYNSTPKLDSPINIALISVYSSINNP